MFKSIFKEDIENFIKEKRFCGYKYISDEKELKRFDYFLFINDINIINEEVIKLWVEVHPNWNINSKARSICIIKELLIYLNKMDKSRFLINNKSYKQKQHQYIPYIFTEEEISKLFREIDKHTSKFYLEMKYIIPTIFRLLYSTGMRIGEVLDIKKKDVDIDNGTISLYDTKNGSDRLIVLSNSMNEYLRKYITKINNNNNNNPYLFSNRYGKQLSKSTIEDIFNNVLISAGITKTDKGPRVHDLRFTFITSSFRNYCQTGKDPMAFLPILQTYVGHSSIKSLEYYLKTTGQDYDNIRKISEEQFSGLIPNVGDIYE